jgi:hypothetical protein
MTASKERSGMTSYISTPSRELTLNCIKNMGSQKHSMASSTTKLFSGSKYNITRALSERSCEIKLYYGEIVISNRFDEGSKIG